MYVNVIRPLCLGMIIFIVHFVVRDLEVIH